MEHLKAKNHNEAEEAYWNNELNTVETNMGKHSDGGIDHRKKFNHV